MFFLGSQFHIVIKINIFNSIQQLQFLFLASLFFVLTPSSLRSQTSENKIKAEYLFNFTHFVTWPKDALADRTSPFQICIFGEDALDKSLDQLVVGEKVQQHSIIVSHIANDEEVSSCQILFLTGTNDQETRYLIRKVAGKPILTVGDGTEFVDQGGIIGLFVKDNKMRLRINLAAAKSAKLDMSSKLLRLSDVIGVEE
jgi:hypothetical protein